MYPRWDEAYRHANRTLPSSNSFQHPSLFIEKQTASGAIGHCVICEKDLATYIDRKAHYKNAKHQMRVSIVYAMQQSEIAMHCAMLQNRMDAEMPDGNSHIPAQLEMYRILLNCHPGDGVMYYPEVLAKKSTAMIDEYTLKLRMGLLELAVWKAICLLHMVATPSQDYHTLQDWCRNGWKVNKAAMRNSNEIGIILRAVLLFMR
jgi:hypothetical protein